MFGSNVTEHAGVPWLAGWSGGGSKSSSPTPEAPDAVRSHGYENHSKVSVQCELTLEHLDYQVPYLAFPFHVLVESV